MADTVYTLIKEAGSTWLAKADDGHLALLVPNLGLPNAFVACDAGHAVLAALEGELEIDGQPWLAYYWHEGKSLPAVLAAGPMLQIEAVTLVLQLLDAAAHGRIMSYALGEIAPDRVWIDEQGAPHLAAMLPAGAPSDDALTGLGEILFFALTATMPVPNERGERPIPSSVVPDIDPRLDAMVLGAMGDPTGTRFEHLLAFRAALKAYLAELKALAAGPVEDEAESTDAAIVELDGNEDFPALSRAVGAITRIGDGDTEKLQALASVILHDFSLTNKVLRLANSASYGQFGGTTSTISRALMVLGFNTVKALAINLVLIEHLTNHEYADALKDEVARAFFASLISRKLAERSHYRDQEEARVAGMFHQLGRLLALFYFHDVIPKTAAASEQSLKKRLGLTFEALGMKVARHWNLPAKLVSSMAIEEPKPRIPHQDADWLRLFANAGNLLMEATLAIEEHERFSGFIAVRDRFGEVLHLTERDFRLVVDEAARETIREAGIFGLVGGADGVLARLRQMAGLPATPKSSSLDDEFAPDTSVVTQHVAPKDRPEVIETLANCVQDVSETLVDEFRLNDLLRMILETVYRSLGVRRVLIATRSVQRNAMVGRFGFGENVEVFLSRFALPLKETDDVFWRNLTKNTDVLVSDINHPSVQATIPAWFRQIGAGDTFLMLPVVVDRKIVGLFYAENAIAGSLQLGPKEFSLCKTLRNQAVLAIRQKSGDAPPRDA